MISRPPTRPQAVALVITLAAVVLITVVVVAFFSRAMLIRQISAANVNQTKADSIAEAALAVLVGDLRNEIAQGSNDPDNDGTPGTTILGVTVYSPRISRAILPARAHEIDDPGSGDDASFVNLVKASHSALPFWRQADMNAPFDGPSRATASNTGNRARNRAGITSGRWNAPLLLGAAPVNRPDWCLVLRKGVSDGATPALVQLANNAPGNTDFAIGRFAFLIYDVGGLLDVNAAGSSLSASDTDRKGRLFAADLSAIPGIADPAALLAWRNPTPVLAWLTDPLNASLELRHDRQPGEKAFVRRQDLLRYATDNPAVLSKDALQYLTSFSRGLNSPSWSPPTNAADLKNSNGSTMNGTNGIANATFPSGPFAYKSNADLPAAANRNLPNVRVQTAFLRADGAPARPGDPLLRNRFPLSRLALVTDSATAANGSEIERFFGLTRSSAAANTPWNYRSGRILTLDEVALAGREPDFFELLKAGILSGSLGKYSGTDHSLRSGYFDRVADVQILKIGANLIDQYDADHHPTVLQVPVLRGAATVQHKIYGLENLPYFNGIYITIFRPNRGNPKYPTMEGWMQFSLWNPNGNASAMPDGNFQIAGTDGKVFLKASNGPNHVSTQQNMNGQLLEFAATGSTFWTPRLLVPSTSVAGVNLGAAQISSINGSTSYGSSPGYFGTASQPYFQDSAGVKYQRCHLAGFYLGVLINASTGSTTIYDRGITGVATDPPGFSWYHAEAQIGDKGYYPTFDLRYQDGNGAWRTYETVEASGIYLDHWNQTGYKSAYSWLNGTAGLYSAWPSGGSSAAAGTGIAYGKSALSCSDPRTKRAGMFRQYALNNEPIVANGTIRPNAWVNRFDTAEKNNGGFPSEPAGLGFTMWNYWSSNNRFQPADLMQNSGNSYVRDFDGIRRRGDGQAAQNVNPFFDSIGPVARPHLLNRPFRSVAEMGYALRDDPWKSLNFFTTDSADAALLDLFTLEEAPVAAGKVSLNTPHAPVIEAILRGSKKAEDSTAPAPLSDAETAQIAAAILALRGTDPFQNPAEIATRIGDSLPTLLSTNPYTNSSDGSIKIRRESVARALSGITETRTWNLMIDVVAQAGRYPPNPRDLDDFLVEGERRYWLHIALDRCTGEIVARQLEPVYE